MAAGLSHVKAYFRSVTPPYCLPRTLFSFGLDLHSFIWSRYVSGGCVHGSICWRFRSRYCINDSVWCWYEKGGCVHGCICYDVSLCNLQGSTWCTVGLPHMSWPEGGRFP